MLPELHDSIQRLLHERGRIDPGEVDVRFDAPTREWRERLTRPTISLFLFDLRENTDLRQVAFQTTRVNGRAEHRLSPRRIDLRYMVSAQATEVEDEHRLLWHTLVTLMRHPEVPAEYLPAELRLPEAPLATRVVQPEDDARILDVWNALGAEPRPALIYVVTAPLDLEMLATAPLILTRTTRYARLNDTAVAVESETQIAGVVRDTAGQPLAGVTVAIEGRAAERSVTNAEGWFSLRGLRAGIVVLRVTGPDGARRAVTVTIPSAGYDITLD